MNIAENMQRTPAPKGRNICSTGRKPCVKRMAFTQASQAVSQLEAERHKRRNVDRSNEIKKYKSNPGNPVIRLITVQTIFGILFLSLCLTASCVKKEEYFIDSNLHCLVLRKIDSVQPCSIEYGNCPFDVKNNYIINNQQQYDELITQAGYYLYPPVDLNSHSVIGISFRQGPIIKEIIPILKTNTDNTKHIIEINQYIYSKYDKYDIIIMLYKIIWIPILKNQLTGSYVVDDPVYWKNIEEFDISSLTGFYSGTFLSDNNVDSVTIELLYPDSNLQKYGTDLVIDGLELEYNIGISYIRKFPGLYLLSIAEIAPNGRPNTINVYGVYNSETNYLNFSEYGGKFTGYKIN